MSECRNALGQVDDWVRHFLDRQDDVLQCPEAMRSLSAGSGEDLVRPSRLRESEAPAVS